MKGSVILYFSFLMLFSCEKENTPDVNEVYVDFIPDLVLYVGDSALIDIDKNGYNDVLFKIYEYESQKRADLINDSCELSMGNFLGSGTGNLDTIAYNEIIDKNSQTWYPYPVGYNLFTQEINYLGVIKFNTDLPSYAWIKLEIMDDSMIIDAYYYSKLPDKKIRAGIYNYD